jgi:hypothetical protein
MIQRNTVKPGQFETLKFLDILYFSLNLMSEKEKCIQLYLVILKTLIHNLKEKCPVVINYIQFSPNNSTLQLSLK